MNPPGIPMLYLASSKKTALKETRAEQGRLGQWSCLRALRVLDLRQLPEMPGYFSDATRRERLTLNFLYHFSADIMIPVIRDKYIHIDYLPSQVVTEYLRDFSFDDGKIDGIAYESTIHPCGWNVVLFCDPVDLHLEEPDWGPRPPQWLGFKGAISCKL